MVIMPASLLNTRDATRKPMSLLRALEIVDRMPNKTISDRNTRALLFRTLLQSEQREQESA